MAKPRKSKQKKLTHSDYTGQIWVRELAIDEMYMTNFGMDEKRNSKEYIR
jgi:hypothetical protein